MYIMNPIFGILNPLKIPFSGYLFYISFIYLLDENEGRTTDSIHPNRDPILPWKPGKCQGFMICQVFDDLLGFLPVF